MLKSKLLVQGQLGVLLLCNLKVGMGDECPEHVEEHKLGGHHKEDVHEVSNQRVVFAHFSHDVQLFVQVSPHRKEGAAVVLELAVVSTERDDTHLDKALEHEEKDYRKVHDLVFGNLNHREQHAHFLVEFLNKTEAFQDHQKHQATLHVSVQSQQVADVLDLFILDYSRKISSDAFRLSVEHLLEPPCLHNFII